MFGVGSTVYYPGDIVEGPDEWKEINPFLEPLPEPKPIIITVTSVAPGAEPIMAPGSEVHEDRRSRKPSTRR